MRLERFRMRKPHKQLKKPQPLTVTTLHNEKYSSQTVVRLLNKTTVNVFIKQCTIHIQKVYTKMIPACFREYKLSYSVLSCCNSVSFKFLIGMK